LPPAEIAALALAVVTVLLALRLNYLEQKGTKRMAGFSAETVVEPLDYDFRTKADRDAIHGTVTEPTDRQIAGYMAGIKKLVKDYEGQLPEGLVTGGADAASLTDAAEELDPEVVVRLHGDVAELFAALCSGEPSKDDILRLPPRIRAHFYGWLQREVMNPEAAPGGGRQQVTTLRAVAAG
jgi:hypothetical protein